MTAVEHEVNYSNHYRSSVYLDGYTYQLSLCFHTEQQENTGELPHSHAQCELHALLQGEATLEPEGYPTLTLRAGDCCMIPPRVYHLRRFASGPVRCAVLSIGCPKGAPLLDCEFDCIYLRCASAVIGYLTALEQEVAVRQIGTEGSIQSWFTLLLTAILRELTALPQEPASARRIPMRREELIDNYFARYYGQDISAQDLAGHIDVTTRQLARIMQQRYGCTFRQHLLEIRLYHARQCLTSTDASIWQIATACGFSNQGAFATAFRRQVGCTPSQYRQRGK